MNTTSNSNSLFHYTRTYDNLCGILRNGFKPKYCKETLLNGSIIGLPLVSFCDIPITRAKTFANMGNMLSAWSVTGVFQKVLIQ